MTRPPLNQWPMAAGLAAVLSAGGCAGLSIPLGEITVNGPAITGSTSAAWPLPKPLPASLALSDATAIAEAARRAFAGDDAAADDGWTNPATGSSGTLTPLGEAEADGGETCRTYASTVTSIKGVHIYTCRVCRTADGQVTIRSLEPAAQQRTAAAGI